MKKYKNFKQKNNFILNKACKEDLDKFTELFYIKSGKTSFENRRTYLKANWLAKEISPRNFKKEYDQYPFSNLTYHGKLLFKDAEEFLTINLKAFEDRISSYVEYRDMVVVPEDLNYKYLYTFSLNRVDNHHHIDYYSIEHLHAHNTEIEIKVTPPKNKKSLAIKPYEGTLKFQKNKIILTFSNSQDYISAIFNPELTNRQTKYLVGVVIGIADFNEKIPIAKKTILTKEPVEDIDELYFVLNETERVLAQENSYKFKHNDKNLLPSHLENYIDKIAMLNRLFEKLLEKGYFPSFYEQLAFKEFTAIHKLFQKVQKHHSFFTHYRKRVLDILIDSYKRNPYKKLSMVMPIYNKENLFEEQSDKALELQNGLKGLSSHVKIEIIFVIKECNKEFKEEFVDFLKEVNSLMKIRFALIKNIENEVDSVDFLFTDRDDFVVSKLLRTNSTLFQLYLHKNTIDDYHTFFRKIAIRSIGYDEFMQKRAKICTKTNPLLKNRPFKK